MTPGLVSDTDVKLPEAAQMSDRGGQFFQGDGTGIGLNGGGGSRSVHLEQNLFYALPEAGQVVSPLESEKSAAMAVLFRHGQDLRGQRAESLGGQVHPSQGVAAVDVEPGRNQDELRPERAGYRAAERA